MKKKMGISTLKKGDYKRFRPSNINSKPLSRILCLLSLLCLFSLIWSNFGYCEIHYTNDQIADAIFLAEGGYKAQYLYGIRSVKYHGYKQARQICLNTIKNNRKRYKDYGYKKYNTYLEFLASRYAPLNCNNDPNNLNRYWLTNVRYFLTNETKP